MRAFDTKPSPAGVERYTPMLLSKVPRITPYVEALKGPQEYSRTIIRVHEEKRYRSKVRPWGVERSLRRDLSHKIPQGQTP